MNRLVEILTFKLFFQIMQQEETLKIFHMLIIVDTSFALKTNLANLKTEIEKLDINKLASAPNNFVKLRNVIKYDVVKKTNYNAKITEIENKISHISNLATKTSLTTVENKIPDINGLTTKTELSTVESKIPDISNLATKTALTNLSHNVPDINTLINKSGYVTKIKKIKRKYVSNTGFDSKLAQANVITKINFDAKIVEVQKNYNI